MTRILVIDDEPTVRSTLTDMLEEIGYEVAEAGNGKDGLTVLSDNPAALVITDILMPEKEGIETIQEIRAIYKTVKIIAMSGGGSTGNMTFLELAGSLGADSVLTKPIHFNDLLKAVESVLQADARTEKNAATA